MYIILESLHGILENFVQLLHIAFENLFHSLALTDPLPPDFVLRLEIYKALLDQFYVEDGTHAFLCLAENFKLVLKD